MAMLQVEQGDGGRAKMREQQLSAAYVRSILDYDPATGIFRWRQRADRAKNWNSRWAGKEAGSLSNGYVIVQIDKPNNYYTGQLAWLIAHGSWPPEQVDHINNDRSDNRLSNLRLATNSQNNQNQGPQRNSRSGFRGVHFHPETGKWRASIVIDRRRHSLGLHATPALAAAARDAGARALVGEFARPAGSAMTRYPRYRRR